MKNLKCSEYRELIMEMVDQELAADMTAMVNDHVKSCHDCETYKNDLINMVNITSSMKVDAPDFLETRVMAAINTGVRKPSFIFSPALSIAATFTVVLIAATFLIYNRAGVPDKAAVIAKNDVKPAISSQAKNPAAKAEISAKIEKAPVKQEIAAVRQAPVNNQPQAAPYMAVPSTNNNMASAMPSVSNVNKTAAVNSVNQADIKAADVVKVESPTPIPLLETDKAIVGNNLINPNKGDAAHIIINVENESLCRIIIYDKNVRVVSRILDEKKTPGKYEAYWNGKNDNGQTVAEGIYFVYIQIDKRVIKKNIIVTKN